MDSSKDRWIDRVIVKLKEEIDEIWRRNLEKISIIRIGGYWIRRLNIVIIMIGR